MRMFMTSPGRWFFFFLLRLRFRSDLGESSVTRGGFLSISGGFPRWNQLFRRATPLRILQVLPPGKPRRSGDPEGRRLDHRGTDAGGGQALWKDAVVLLVARSQSVRLIAQAVERVAVAVIGSPGRGHSGAVAS